MEGIGRVRDAELVVPETIDVGGELDPLHVELISQDIDVRLDERRVGRRDNCLGERQSHAEAFRLAQ